MTTTPTEDHIRVRRYPLAQTDTDARFTLGLVLDVAAVLKQHGYPSITAENPLDHVELRQALFEFLYTREGSEHA